MKLEDQVCSLALAKKLKLLGVEKESIFVWDYLDENAYGVRYVPYSCMGERYSAFTVAELFEMLPAFVDTKQNEPFNNFYFTLTKRTALNIQYIINYECDTTHVFNERPSCLMAHNIYDENLADCLAKALIYLVEQGLIQL